MKLKMTKKEFIVELFEETFTVFMENKWLYMMPGELSDRINSLANLATDLGINFWAKVLETGDDYAIQSLPVAAGLTIEEAYSSLTTESGAYKGELVQ